MKLTNVSYEIQEGQEHEPREEDKIMHISKIAIAFDNNCISGLYDHDDRPGMEKALKHLFNLDKPKGHRAQFFSGIKNPPRLATNTDIARFKAKAKEITVTNVSAESIKVITSESGKTQYIFSNLNLELPGTAKL